MPATFFGRNVKEIVDYECPVPMSEQFYEFMDRKITELIKKEIGLSPSGRAAICASNGWLEYKPFYEVKPDFYCLNPELMVYDFGHPFKFCWRSKTGKPVPINVERFDEDDLEYWIEGPVREEVYLRMAESEYNVPPFKIKNLPFEVDVKGYGYTMMIYISLDDAGIFTVIKDELNLLIDKFNQLADARALGQKKGPILLAAHHWEIKLEDDERISIYIDAASPEILDKMMKVLASYPQVKKVEMDMI